MSSHPAPTRMHVPPAYRADDPRGIIAAYPFATLFSATAQGLFATAAPLYFETDAPDEKRLIGHIATANPHAAALVTDDPALAVFAGPHAYISANWYRDRPTVPTWNYVIAQARVIVERIDDPAAERALMERTAQMTEHGHAPRWTLDDAPPGRVGALMPGITSFRLAIVALDGATKLSQTQPEGDRGRVIAALEGRDWFGDAEIAQLMRDREA